MTNFQLGAGRRERRVEPAGLTLGLGRRRDREGAVEHGEEGTAGLEVVDQVGADPRRAVRGQVEEGPVEPRALVEVLVVADARHERDPFEDLRGAEEEVVPVRPLVAPVDQVAGQEDEVDPGMPAERPSERACPSPRAPSGRRPGRGTRSAPDGCGPSWPSAMGPSRHSSRRPASRDRSCRASGRPPPPNDGGSADRSAGRDDRTSVGSALRPAASARGRGRDARPVSADSNRAGTIRIRLSRTSAAVRQVQTSSRAGSDP